jgi:hypothetical protein
MLNKRISLIALGMLSATQAMANDQAESKGFVEDSSLKVLLRNAYINRDYKNGNDDKAEWGQAAIGTFSSGFTQGTVGVGVDAFGLYALRLDGGKGRSGAGGIDFFKQGDSGNAADDLSKFGAAVKFRLSSTTLTYGDQMPALPVLNYDNSRLLPESYTGTLITSREIKGLELNAGRFTAESRKSAEGRDSGGLKSINVLGGSYQFTEQFKAALYASDVEEAIRERQLRVPDRQGSVPDPGLQRLPHQAGQLVRPRKHRSWQEHRYRSGQQDLEPGSDFRHGSALVHRGAPAFHRRQQPGLRLRRLPERSRSCR